jgi:hypothetical protein
MWEKRFPSWLRRPSEAEGSSSLSSSVFGACLDASEGSGSFTESADLGFLESSPYRRTCERILHCRQMDVRIDGRLDIRSVLEAGEEAIGSKTSLEANRAKGCMAGLCER